MSSRQMIQKAAWSAAILTLALSVAACSGDGRTTAGTVSPDESASPASSDPTGPASAADNSSASPSSSEVQTGSGEYTGLIDNHSIEIQSDGQPQAYQIDPETADKVSSWDEGTKVKFLYIEQTLDVEGQQIKQYMITVIDKA